QPEGAEDDEERPDVEVRGDDRVEAVQPAACGSRPPHSHRLFDCLAHGPASARMRASSPPPAAPGGRPPGAARRGYLADGLGVLEELSPRLHWARLVLLD